jgi:hypothetical protein
MNQESIFRIKGTKLPIITYGTEYTTSLIYHTCEFSDGNEKENIHLDSNGLYRHNGRTYISAKSKGLPILVGQCWEGLYLFKESDLIKLAEEQGIEWRVKPEFVIPKGHQIQITADNLNDINKLRDINNELFKSHMTLDNIGNYIIHTQIGNYLLRGVYEDDYILIDNNSNKTNMEKKIIGYKLKFVEYKDAVRVISDDNEFDFDLFKREWQQYPSTKKKLERAKLLNVWFEPVYEYDFKVGDYVTVIKEAPSYEGKVNKTYLITNIDGQSLYFADMRAINTKLVEVRLATPEEIEAINNKVINIGFDVKIKNKRAFVGNDDITEFVLGLVKQYNNLDYGTHGGFGHKIKDITFSKTGCKSVDTKLSDWKKIYDEIKPSSYSNIGANAC